MIQSTQNDQLYPLLKEHHAALLKLKVKKPLYTHNMQDIISHINTPDIGFKFSGAGGGDNMMIATTRDKIHQVIKEIPTSYPIINNYIKGVIHVE